MGNWESRAAASDPPSVEEAPARAKRRGFENLGNSCYLAAVVVALASLPALVDALEQLRRWAFRAVDVEVDEKQQLQMEFVIELAEVIGEFRRTRVAPSARRLLRLAGRLDAQFRGRRPQDAHEFLSMITEACETFSDVHDAHEGRPRTSRLFADFPLFFRTRSRITCGECGREADSTEECVGLSEWPPFRQRPPVAGVDVGEREAADWSLWSAWTGRELLVDDAQFQCDHCGRKVDAVRTLRPLSLPDCLVVHYKLFRMQTEEGRVVLSKRTRVPFPPLQIPLEAIPTAGGEEESGAAYTLKALVVHAGGALDDGHFFCARRRRSDFSEWRLFDDELVEVVGLAALRRLTARSTTPYLMFYEKTRPSVGPSSESDEQKNSLDRAPPSSSH
ncbi:Ubiquitin carboxyl-terminal hydrolase 23-like isoform X2 [Aphelenchoides fujianensis]|nr:Ubiquitin carboxyl-terminal hydrolase 23-like isoform X2 [Aphelenchoides fujianensis]